MAYAQVDNQNALKVLYFCHGRTESAILSY